VALTILKKISQWEGLSHILLKIKNVPNHQPDYHPSNHFGEPGNPRALEAMRELLGQHGHAGWIHHGQNVKATALRNLSAWVTLG